MKKARSVNNCYFVTQIVLTYCEKNCSRTIYSNSERSEQLLVTECFFNLFLEVSHIGKNRTIRIQTGKKLLGFRNIQEKLENSKFLMQLTLYFVFFFSLPGTH